MFFLIKLFRNYYHPKVQFLGRAGVVYKDVQKKYFIDSEMLFGPNYDIVIYPVSVEYYNAEGELAPGEKMIVAEKLKKELEWMRMRVDVM